MTQEEKWADRINKLLAQAEHSNTSDTERDAFIEKAQALMTQYAISEAMIATQRGEAIEEIVSERLTFTGSMQKTTMGHVFVIARFHNCRAHYMTGLSTRTTTKSGKDKWATSTDVVVVGFKSDVERLKLLSASLDIQRATALSRWWKESTDKHYMSRFDQFVAKRSFVNGFNTGLAAKLHEADRAGRAAAVHDEATRSKITEQDAEKSVALVLKSRTDQVKDWYDEKYGGSIRPGRATRSRSSYSARGAGVAAGRSADTGTPRVGGNRGALQA